MRSALNALLSPIRFCFGFSLGILLLQSLPCLRAVLAEEGDDPLAVLLRWPVRRCAAKSRLDLLTGYRSVLPKRTGNLLVAQHIRVVALS